MAIAAQRFKFLDKETNIPTVDFSSLSDNQVYNNFTELVDSAIASTKEADTLLEAVAESMSELAAMIESGVASVMDSINAAVNSIIDSLSKIELPGILKKALDFIKKFSPTAMFDFFKDALKAGGRFLCNNLDFLKMFMLGFSLTGSLLSGLLIGLIMSLLDSICKSMSKEDQASSSKLEILENIVPPTGNPITTGNAFGSFVNTVGDYAKKAGFTVTSNPMSIGDFINNVKDGNVLSSITNLKASEITSTVKQAYTNAINTTLSTVTRGTPQYNNLLQAKGDLFSVPLVSEERRLNEFSFSNVSDQLGSLAKNIVNVDLSSVNKLNMSPVEKGIYEKLVTFKQSSSSNPEISSRTFNSGSFSDFDFEEVLPSFTEEENEFFSSKSSGTSHRVHDIHPTTAVFLEV